MGIIARLKRESIDTQFIHHTITRFSMKYFHCSIIGYQDYQKCFQEKSSLTASLVSEVNCKNARIQVGKKKKKQSLVLSGHLDSRADLGQQASVATMVMCHPTLTAE